VGGDDARDEERALMAGEAGGSVEMMEASSFIDARDAAGGEPGEDIPVWDSAITRRRHNHVER